MHEIAVRGLWDFHEQKYEEYTYIELLDKDKMETIQDAFRYPPNVPVHLHRSCV